MNTIIIISLVVTGLYVVSQVMLSIVRRFSHIHDYELTEDSSFYAHGTNVENSLPIRNIKTYMCRCGKVKKTNTSN